MKRRCELYRRSAGSGQRECMGRTTKYSRRPGAGRIDTEGEAVLERWATAMQAEGVSASTIELRVGAVRLCVRHSGRRIDQLRADDVRRWLAEYANPNTRSTYHAAVARLYAWLTGERLVTENPLQVMRPPRVPRGAPRPCTSADLAKLLLAAAPRDQAMIMLGAYQGLRRAEIAAVHGTDIDLDAESITVIGKGGVRSVLPLHPEVLALAVRMPRADWWFPSPQRPGEPISPQVVSLAIRAACRAAGVPEHGAHRLRHWYATSLVRSGTDLRTTQTLMRHASLATTARYVEVEDAARRAAVLRLPRLGTMQ